LQLQNNSNLGVEVNLDAYSFMHYTSKFRKIGCLALGMIYWQAP